MPLLGAVAALAVVLYLCWAFSKFMGKRMNAVSASSNIHILERVALGQDKCLLIAKIGANCYLMSVTGQEIRVLMPLDESELKQQSSEKGGSFAETLSAAVKAMGGKNVDKPNGTGKHGQQ